MWRREDRVAGSQDPVPIADLVRRAFRSGTLIPFIVLAVLFAVTVPIATVDGQANQGKDYSAVLHGVISDRTALFLGKAGSVARLIGTGGERTVTDVRLEQLVELDPAIDAAIASDRFGNVMASAQDAGATGREVDTDALTWVRLNKTSYISPPNFDPFLGDQSVVMAVPILSATDDLRGMLQIHVNTKWMTTALERINNDLDVNMFVVDSRGRVVAHTDQWRVLSSQTLPELDTGLVIGLDDERVISGVADVPEWRGEIKVVTTWPVSVVYLSVAAGMIPVAIVLVAYVVTVRSRRRLIASVVEPVQELEAAIESYGPANLDARAGPTGVVEFDVVAVIFNETANRIDSLVESLRDSNTQLEEFASIAAHDLQEPLRKVRAFGDMLARSTEGNLDEDASRYLERMQDAAARMQQLIDDLLVYSRLTTRAAPAQPVDLNQTVANVLDDLDFAIGEAGTAVDVGRLPTVDAEPTQMYQLVQNLISNSLKFRREGVAHRIEINADEPIAGQARITIADNGIGFSEEYSEQIFKIFERLHGRSSYSGTGIGLALCRKIVERHGGSIAAEGVDGHGATFTITLPVRTRELIDA